MSSLIPKILLEATKLKEDSICSHCCSNNFKQIKVLHNCEHILCNKCYNSTLSKCPVCKKPMLCERNLLMDQGVNSFLKMIHNIINRGPSDFKNTTFETYFTPLVAVDKRDHKGETRLHKYCREGNLEKVTELLEMGCDINIQDFAGWTPLYEAITASRYEIASLLLENGAFPNVPGINYITPLHTAVEKDDVDLIKVLMKFGAEFSNNGEGKSPIDLCKSDLALEALCLTARTPKLYKIYTIPPPNVFLINVNPDDLTVASPMLNIKNKRAYLSVGSDVNYVIVGDLQHNILELQVGILQGCCIVTTNWLKEYVTKNSLIFPLNYLFDHPEFEIRKAVMNGFNKLPKLFDGLHFCFLHNRPQVINGEKYTIEDLKMLIILGGGKVIKRQPTRVDIYYPFHAEKDGNLATVSYYLICDEEKVPKKSQLSGIKYKSAQWLIDCINSFSIISQ